MKRGIKQGDSLSPLLFIIFMDAILKKCRSRIPKVKVGNWKLSPTYISNLAFADDLVTMADTPSKLQTALNIWQQELTNHGMEMNIAKTKIMHIRGNKEERTQERITIKDQEVEWVDYYDYLGVRISETGKIDEEILNRTRKGSQVYYQLNQCLINKKEVSIDAKMRIYNAIYVPTLLYGLESAVLQEKHKKSIQASEMKFLRRAIGKTKKDRVRNTKIRKDVDQTPLNDILEQKQLKWYGHLVRMDENRIVKKIFQCKEEGKRRRGRPRTSFEQHIEQLGRKRGKTKKEMEKLAMNRKEYGKWTEAPTLNTA